MCIRDRLAPLPLTDTDGDGVPNYLDLDSDDDGTSDLVESGGTDVDGDGRIDLFNDSDADGIPDSADASSTGGTDSDSDGIDDAADVDFTGGEDTNGNGIDDLFEADPDGDGRATAVAGDISVLPDADGDGTPDFLDVPGGTTTTLPDTAPALITGLSGTGFGCSIMTGQPGRLDPVLPASLLTLTMLVVSRGNRRKNRGDQSK